MSSRSIYDQRANLKTFFSSKMGNWIIRRVQYSGHNHLKTETFIIQTFQRLDFKWSVHLFGFKIVFFNKMAALFGISTGGASSFWIPLEIWTIWKLTYFRPFEILTHPNMRFPVFLEIIQIKNNCNLQKEMKCYNRNIISIFLQFCTQFFTFFCNFLAVRNFKNLANRNSNSG